MFMDWWPTCCQGLDRVLSNIILPLSLKKYLSKDGLSLLRNFYTNNIKDSTFYKSLAASSSIFGGSLAHFRTASFLFLEEVLRTKMWIWDKLSARELSHKMWCFRLAVENWKGFGKRLLVFKEPWLKRFLMQEAFGISHVSSLFLFNIDWILRPNGADHTTCNALPENTQLDETFQQSLDLGWAFLSRAQLLCSHICLCVNTKALFLPNRTDFNI